MALCDRFAAWGRRQRAGGNSFILERKGHKTLIKDSTDRGLGEGEGRAVGCGYWQREEAQLLFLLWDAKAILASVRLSLFQVRRCYQQIKQGITKSDTALIEAAWWWLASYLVLNGAEGLVIWQHGDDGAGTSVFFFPVPLKE